MIERYNQKVRKPSFNLTFHSMKVQASGSIMPTSDVRNEGGETGGSGLGSLGAFDGAFLGPCRV